MLLKSPHLHLEMHFHSTVSYTPGATVSPGDNSITIQSRAYKGIASASNHTDTQQHLHVHCPIDYSRQTHTHSDVQIIE